jgi:hypothetical protein
MIKAMNAKGEKLNVSVMAHRSAPAVMTTALNVFAAKNRTIVVLSMILLRHIQLSIRPQNTNHAVVN